MGSKKNLLQIGGDIGAQGGGQTGGKQGNDAHDKEGATCCTQRGDQRWRVRMQA